jgi:hypothetical protein
MSNIEVIIKDITKPKLTLTPTRCTVKFPLNFSEEFKPTILKEAEEVYTDYLKAGYQHSIRGGFFQIPNTNVFSFSPAGKVSNTMSYRDRWKQMKEDFGGENE